MDTADLHRPTTMQDKLPGNFQPMIASRLPVLILSSPVCSGMTAPLTQLNSTSTQAQSQLYLTSTSTQSQPQLNPNHK